MQTAGGVVTLTSDQFIGLELIPDPDTSRPNRWTNFAVIVEGDTADSWRTYPTQIAFRVPPVYTGNHDATITATGFDDAHVTIYGVGLAFPAYWGGLNPYTNVSSGTLLLPRGLLVAETTTWPGFSEGYGLVDVQGKKLDMIPALQAGTNHVRMYAPGLSYRADHFIFDLSPIHAAAPKVWRADPWTLVDSIPCGDPDGDYTAAEISPTTCLSLRLGTLVRNGTDTLLQQSALFNGDFRMASGGTWTVVRTELYARQFRGPTMHWPVLNNVGDLAYTIDTLFHVTGAAFSNDGDTLFITASVPDSTAPNAVGGRFFIAALETATGRFLMLRTFETDRAVQDVIVDPVRSWLYVASVRTEPTNGLSGVRQYLTVLERGTFSHVADMPAAGDVSVHDANLVYQGSAGRVSVVGWCGVDCGGLTVFTFDLP
ncbi:MAG TPA: hypothetical protein VN803_03935 [Gemmatimonadales bacterium]|nr:hypothetical protein [Gemmatimonadales bacterium]